MNLGFVWAETLSFGMCSNVGIVFLPVLAMAHTYNIASRLNSIKTLNVANTFKTKFKVHLNIEKTKVLQFQS